MASLPPQEAISPHQDGAPQRSLSLPGPSVEQKDHFSHQSVVVASASASGNGQIHLHAGASPRPREHFHIRSLSTQFNLTFEDKNKEYESIKQALSRKANDNKPSGCAIWGMAGIGKTRLVHRYLEHATEFCKVVLKASTEQSLERSIKNALMKMRLANNYDGDIDSAINTLKHHFEVEWNKSREIHKCLNGDGVTKTLCRGWLLVVDDIRDETLEKVWEIIQIQGGDGRVLLTSRSRFIAERLISELFPQEKESTVEHNTSPESPRCIEMELPDATWAASIFSRISEITPDGEQAEKIADIVEAVGHLPLAIEIAATQAQARNEGLLSVWERRNEAADWKNTSLSYEFHPRFQKNKVLKHAFDFLWDFKETPNYLEEVLFAELCFLNPHKISIDFLEQTVGKETQAWTFKSLFLGSRPKSERVNDVIRRLEESLLLNKKFEEHQAFVWIHSLVQQISRKDLYAGNISYKYVDIAVKHLKIALEAWTGHNRPIASNDQIDEILDHVQAMIARIAAFEQPPSRYRLLLLNLEEKLLHALLYAGRYDVAHKLAQRIYDTRLNLQARTCLDVARCCNLLGITFQRLGNYKKAEEHCESAKAAFWDSMKKISLIQRTADREIRFGEWLTCLESLASVQCCQGRYQRAKHVMKTVKHHKERKWDRGHVENLQADVIMSSIYRAYGSYDRSAEFAKRASEGRVRILGECHNYTLESQQCYALALHKTGRYSRAEEMMRRVVVERRKILGEIHPETLESQNNLAAVLQDQGKYSEAEECATKSLNGRKNLSCIGRKHPATWSSQSTLSEIYLYQGKFNRARQLSSQALRSQERALGSRHPHTSTTRCVLATAEFHLGNYSQAYSLYDEALKGRTEMLPADGPKIEEHPEILDHPDILNLIRLRCCVISALGDSALAARKLSAVLERQQEVIGINHPVTSMSRIFLATELLKSGQYKKAAEAAGMALTSLENSSSPRHFVLTSLHVYATILCHQGQYQEAEDKSREVYEGRLEDLGGDHPCTVAALESYSTALYHNGHYEKAAGHALNALQKQEELFGDLHPVTLESLNNYCSVLLSNNNKGASGRVHRALSMRVDQLAQNHRIKLVSRLNHIKLLRNEQKYREAIECGEALDDRMRRSLGAKHPYTLSTGHQLGLAYLEDGKFQEAERILSEVTEDRVSVLGREHPDTACSEHYHRLVSQKLKPACNELNVEMGDRSGD